VSNVLSIEINGEVDSAAEAVQDSSVEDSMLFRRRSPL